MGIIPSGKKSLPIVGEPIFLQSAVGFVGDGHFN
jgi:hypothetical protein